MASGKTYTFVDEKLKPDDILAYPPESELENVPLIIDNGSYQFRAGWGHSSTPSLVFKNVIARNRGNKKDREWDVLVGNDIPDLEAVRWMIRTAFDFNVVVNFSVQEIIFDHAFAHLGINTEGRICHPVVLTEPAANPSYSRKQMSELLFEAYSIPKIAYGVDGLFSYEYNKNPMSLAENALIVSSGFQSTHVMPITGGKMDLNGCKRINLGGYNNGAYLQRVLQLKYPKQSSVFTLTRMDEILRQFGEVTTDYMEEIRKWENPLFKSENTIMMKIPEKNNPTGGQGTNPPSERMISLGRELRQLEYKLFDLECVLELEQENPDVFVKAMTDAGCLNVEDINMKMKKFQNKIDKIQEELTSLSSRATQLREIPLTLEKHQSLEVLFKPSLVGYDQAGIGECMETALGLYPESLQNEMAQNVLITGGNTQYSGFTERIRAELVKCRPFQSECQIHVAEDPSLDAWKGARQWAMENIADEGVWVTRKDFDENGWEYMKEHRASNMCFQPVSG